MSAPEIHKNNHGRNLNVYVTFFVRNGMNEDAFQQRNHLANIIGLEICLKS